MKYVLFLFFIQLACCAAEAPKMSDARIRAQARSVERRQVKNRDMLKDLRKEYQELYQRWTKRKALGLSFEEREELWLDLQFVRSDLNFFMGRRDDKEITDYTGW